MRLLIYLFIIAAAWGGVAQAQQPGCVNNTPCVQPNVFVPTGAGTLAVTTTSASVTFPTTGGNLTLKVTNAGAVTVYYAVGGAGVVATTASAPLAAGQTVALAQGSNGYLAAVTASGTASLTLQSGTGVPIITYGASGSGCAGGLSGCQIVSGISMNYGALLSNAGTPTAAGTGYTALSAFTVSGGTCTTQPGGVVDAVTAGVPQTYHITQQGVCTVPPTNPVATTASGGIGMTLTLAWGPLAANVPFSVFVSNGINGETVLGNLGGFGRLATGLGMTAYGYSAAGGGANTGDLMGGGTGFTAGELTAIGNLGCAQATALTYSTCVGHNAGGHISTGASVNLFGSGAGKWMVNPNQVTCMGWGTCGYLLNPSYVTATGNLNAVGGNFLNVAVTGAANNGSGLVRLAVTSTTGWATGDTAVVTGVVGTTEANGYWPNITVVDGTHVDLTGSSYAHAWTSGGSVNDFTTVKLSYTTLTGYSNLTSNALRSTGTITGMGINDLTACTTCSFVVFGGVGTLQGLTTGAQHVAFGDIACNTLVTGYGDVCIGYNSDVAGSGNNNAVAIGGNGSGGGKGAVASDSGYSIGANTGAVGMGSNMGLLGRQTGTDCVAANNNMILIGNNNNAGCGSSTNYTSALVVAWDATFGKITPAASHTMNIGGILTATGTDTPSTSATSVAGTFNVAGLYKANGTSGVSCAANTVTILTFVVTNGIVTHC